MTMSRAGVMPAFFSVDQRHHLLDADALHVHGAAAPDLAVLNDGGERVDLPRLAVHRNDIQMVQQQQRLLRRSRPAHARHQIGLAVRPAGIELRGDAVLFENALERNWRPPPCWRAD